MVSQNRSVQRRRRTFLFCFCFLSTCTVQASSTFPGRLPSKHDHDNSSRKPWYTSTSSDGASSDDGEEDEIESSSDDESQWRPPSSVSMLRPSMESASSAAPLNQTAEATVQKREEDQVKELPQTSDSFAPLPSQPLQTLQKLQSMLDETDYLTSASQRPLQSPPPPETGPSKTLHVPPLVPQSQIEKQSHRLWTSKDRAKYKKQQQKLRRQQEELRQRTRTRLQSSPPIHPFSDDEPENMSDDMEDGLGYTLPNIPVYYSDTEGESDSEQQHPSSSMMSTNTVPVLPSTTMTATNPEQPLQSFEPQFETRSAPPDVFLGSGGDPYQSLPPPPPNYYAPHRLIPPPASHQQQQYAAHSRDEGMRPQQYYQPYPYHPSSYPYNVYSPYGHHLVQPTFHGQYGAWAPPPPPGFAQQRPSYPGALTRRPSPHSQSPRMRTDVPNPSTDIEPLNTTSSRESKTTSFSVPSAPIRVLAQLEAPSAFARPMVSYSMPRPFFVAPENPQSLAEASSHLSLVSIEKISLLLATVALACYAGVSPRTLPLDVYNLKFYENLRLVSLAFIAPCLQVLCVFGARENDINALVNSFFVSFTLGYILTFATEIVVTTLVRLGVFWCFESKIFSLTPKVPVPILPWVLRDVQYRPKRITLFAADFATTCVACPIIEEYIKLKMLQWTVKLPRNFNWVTRVSTKRNKKKRRTVAEAVMRYHGEDVVSANKYVTQMLAVTLGLKLCDAGRRILLYTKAHHVDKSFFAIFRGIFPIQELCGTMTALALAKRDLLGFHTPLWKMLAPAVVLHGMANYRGKKPIFKWNSATPWSEMQLYPLNFADSSTLPQLLSKGFGKLMWVIVMGRILGYCIKNYYMVNRQAVKRTTTYAGKHAAFSAELATAEVLKKQKLHPLQGQQAD